MRSEHDLLGDRNVPVDAYYGIQTLRAKENYEITDIAISREPRPPSRRLPASLTALPRGSQLDFQGPISLTHLLTGRHRLSELPAGARHGEEGGVPR